jgi:hypothetical protein
MGADRGPSVEAPTPIAAAITTTATTPTIRCGPTPDERSPVAREDRAHVECRAAEC